MRRRTVLAAGAAAALALAVLLLRSASGPEPGPPPEGPPREEPPSAPEARPPTDPVPTPPSAPAAKGPIPGPAAPPEEPPKPALRVVVAGRVVGPRDEGIPGAMVSLFTLGDVAGAPSGSLRDALAGNLRDPGPASFQTAGPDACFRFEVSPVALASLRAEKSSWTPARIDSFSLLADCDGIRLRLGAPAPVAGVVITGGREPVPVEGAQVLLLGPATPFNSGMRRLLGSATTDGKGIFRAVGSPPGEAEVVVLAKGMKPRWLPRIPVPTEGLEVRVEPATFKFLRGVVLLPDGTTPAARIRVTATTRPRGRPAEEFLEALTDGAGRFAFDEVEWTDDGGPLAMEFLGGDRGYARLERIPWPGDSEESVVLEALPDGVLRGRAVEIAPDGSRRPVADVALRGHGIWESRAGRIAIERTDRTRADGSFALPRLPDREASIRPEDFYGPWAVALPPRGILPARPAVGPWEVEVVLEPNREARAETEATVAGRVVAPDGTPVAGARVDGFGPGGLTDREGRYVLRGPVRREGIHAAIRASAEEFLPTPPLDVFVQPGADPTDLWLRFTVPLLPMTGRVLDGDGRPLAGVQVVLRGIGGSADRGGDPATTGPDGAWRSRGSPGSLWRVTVFPSGWMPGKIDQVQAGDPVPDIVLVRNPAAAPAQPR